MTNKLTWNENQEKVKAYHLTWRSENQEKVKAYHLKWRSENRERMKAAAASWRKANPIKSKDLARKSRLKTKYGMTAEQVDEMMTKGCYICGSREKLQVDHCHVTGIVRGILCRSHNLLLGYAKDDAMILRAAADYLNKSMLDTAGERE